MQRIEVSTYMQRRSHARSWRDQIVWVLLVLFAGGVAANAATPDDSAPRFRVIALAEPGGIHQPFVEAAKWIVAGIGSSLSRGFLCRWIERLLPM